jgi:hypothetical protein
LTLIILPSIDQKYDGMISQDLFVKGQNALPGHGAFCRVFVVTEVEEEA